MKRLAQAGFVLLAFGAASAQPAPADCTVGRLEVGGPAPKFNKAEYSRGVDDVSSWFYVRNAKRYRCKWWAGPIRYEQFVEMLDNRLVAVVREFTMEHADDVLAALYDRYGKTEVPHGVWLSWAGDSSEAGHVTWYDRDCGLRIDAFKSIDPGDPDERFIIVWTKGVNTPGSPAAASIR
jgi:hypothetical protein